MLGSQKGESERLHNGRLPVGCARGIHYCSLGRTACRRPNSRACWSSEELQEVSPSPDACTKVQGMPRRCLQRAPLPTARDRDRNLDDDVLDPAVEAARQPLSEQLLETTMCAASHLKAHGCHAKAYPVATKLPQAAKRRCSLVYRSKAVGPLKCPFCDHQEGRDNDHQEGAADPAWTQRLSSI